MAFSTPLAPCPARSINCSQAARKEAAHKEPAYKEPAHKEPAMGMETAMETAMAMELGTVEAVATRSAIRLT
jgi:hypothetical protein